MSAQEESRFSIVEEKIKTIEHDVRALKRASEDRAKEMSEFKTLLTEIKIILQGGMGAEGIVRKTESMHSKLIFASGFGAAFGFIGEFLMKKLGIK